VDIAVDVNVEIFGEDCGCAAANNCAGFLQIDINGEVFFDGVNDDASVLAHLPCSAESDFLIAVSYVGVTGDIQGRPPCEWNVTIRPETRP
jgi:hypothetical protein